MRKSERFEVFKRDSFTCQYCGRRPPDVVLEVDHIEPASKGGSSDLINLITSCFDCNRGKSDKRLGDVVPRPDADLAYLQVQQEVAEAKRYLDAIHVKEQLEIAIRDRLEVVWCDSFDTKYIPTKPQWRSWMRVFSPEEIEVAIKATVRFNSMNHPGATQLVKYVSGVLWNTKKGRTPDAPSSNPRPSETQLSKWPHTRGERVN